MEGTAKNHNTDACPVLKGEYRPTHTMSVGLCSRSCCKTHIQRCCARTRWSSHGRHRDRRRRRIRRCRT